MGAIAARVSPSLSGCSTSSHGAESTSTGSDAFCCQPHNRQTESRPMRAASGSTDLQRAEKQPEAIRGHQQHSAALRSTPQHSAALRSNPQQSVALRSDPQQSAAVSSNQQRPKRTALQSEAIRCNPKQSVAIRSNPLQSEAIRCDPKQSAALRSNPLQSEAIRCNPLQSKAIRSDPLQSPARQRASVLVQRQEEARVDEVDGIEQRLDGLAAAPEGTGSEQKG